MAERRGWISWSEQEKIDLVDVWSRPEGLKCNLHMFNGRTIDALKGQAHKMGLPRRSTGLSNRGGVNEPLILKMLEARPMDIREIAAKLGIWERPTRFRVYALHAAGKIHVDRWERFSPRGRPSRMWALGVGEDAPQPNPVPQSVRERNRLKRMRREDPDAFERHLARKRTAQRIRMGTLVKRDPAAEAIFGPAAKQPSRRPRTQTGASTCA